MVNIRHKLLLLFLVQSGLIFLPENHALGYELGDGFRSGDFYLSGYTTIEIIDRFNVPKRLDLDDLSLFAGANINRAVNPFAEVELSKQTLIREGGNPVNGDVIVERFYNDVTVSESDTLRIGKMLAPIGKWNQIHATPLVPTITRPYTTALGFDAYTSGINWIKEEEDNGKLDFQIYGEPGVELFKRPASQSIRSFSHTLGANISIPLGLLDSAGLSFQHGEYVETGEIYTLVGVDVEESFNDLKFQSEAITARFSGTVLSGSLPRLHDTEAGIFVLADYSLTPKWHTILEGEYYQDHTVDEPSRSTSINIAYKYKPSTVWKLEYIHQAGVSASFAPISTGFKASFATLF